MKDYLVIIPAYNEEKAIGDVLSGIIANGYLQLVDVLVINDASSDGTADVVKSFEQVNLITHVFNLGYGSSLQTGYRYALRMVTNSFFRWTLMVSMMYAISKF